MSKKTLLLIDGNGLLYRAYHAFPKELTTKTGQPIGAVYGFTRILLSSIKTLKPDCVGVCFDLKGPTFRHAAYDQYKATRQKMPDDLAGQIEQTWEVVKTLEIPIYTKESFEADDVIGTIARHATAEDPEQKVIIVSGDQDILQLVTNQVSVYAPSGSQAKPPTMYTPEKVQEKYTFAPRQMIDYKALRGDPSDNIPGVPGIGEVTATKLIQEFGTLDHLYQELKAGHVTSLKPALLEKLTTNEELARLSYSLATIHTEVPVDFQISACSLSLNEPEKVVSLFKELGFKSLINDLPLPHRLPSLATEVFSTPDEPTSAPSIGNAQAEQIDADLEPILRAMEARGVKVDCTYLSELEHEFDLESEKIKQELFTLAGEEFNPDSPSQVAHTFYETLQIPTKNIRKGKTGYTTDASTLQELAEAYPIASLLLQYREVVKLQNTYVRPLQQITDEHSRVHTSYAPDTATGRLSSRNPNLQNIPVRSEQGRRLRRAFVAEEGYLLLAADYSQLELRIAAHLADDPTMKAAFTAGRDFHSETAALIGVDRRIAKIINFSILFGKGAFGFAKDMNVSVAEAKQYIEQYFQTYPNLRRYLDECMTKAKKDGYLESMFGRRRDFPELLSSNFQRRAAAEREAMNMPIQGTEADILKMAMTALAAKLSESQLDAHLILTVHDELVLEVSPTDLGAAAHLLQETMTQTTTLSVPLRVSLKKGQNWAEMEEFSLEAK